MQGTSAPESLSGDLARSIALNSYDVVIHTRDGVVIWASPSLTEVTGWAPSDIIGTRFEGLVHPDDRLDLLRVSSEGTVRRRRRLRRPDDTYIWMEGKSRPFVTPEGVTDGAITLIRGVDAEHVALVELQRERELLKAAQESMLDAYSLLEAVRDASGRVVDFVYADVNAAALKHHGARREELVGSTLLSRAPGRRSALFARYVYALETGEPIVIDDYPDPDAPAGEERYLDIRGIRVGDAISFTLRDVTERWRAREALRQRAEYDELTGLVNRGEVLRRLDRAFAHQVRSGSGTAIAFCDVDGFKAVNDAHGHAVGDVVLRVVGQRMAQALRESDTVARFGGDEFLVVLEGVDDLESARLVMEQVRQEVLQPLHVDGERMNIGLSVGVVMLDRQQSVGRHVSEADRAMFEAKRAGGGVLIGSVSGSVSGDRVRD